MGTDVQYKLVIVFEQLVVRTGCRLHALRLSSPAVGAYADRLNSARVEAV